MSGIADLVNKHVWRKRTRDALTADLVQREDELADHLRNAGAMFGLYPQIVAKVLMDLEFGSPVDDDMRMHINTQFAGLMEAIRRAQQGE